MVVAAALDIGALCGVVAGDPEMAPECSCVRSSMLGNGKTCGVVAGDSVTAPGVPCSQDGFLNSRDLGSFSDSNDSGWIRMNYDTGAAVTAIPRTYAPEGTSGNGQRYRTATGEYTEDCGQMRITGELENGEPRRITGRLAAVHKILVSAGKVAGFGLDGWISTGGGFLIQRSSRLGKRIARMIAHESTKPHHTMTPLYEENGVYNFYLRSGTPNSKIEVLDGGAVRSLGHEEEKREQSEEERGKGTHTRTHTYDNMHMRQNDTGSEEPPHEHGDHKAAQTHRRILAQGQTLAQGSFPRQP